MENLVSVIVPIYGVEGLLRRCVDSILRQSHSDVEIILVDDGSPDRSGEICDSYAAQDRRVKVLHCQNQGPAQARNVGLDLATGDFITFVDGDDWIDTRLVEALLGLADQYDAGISICRHVRTQTDDVRQEDGVAVVQELTVEEALRQLNGPNEVVMSVLWGKLYRRELFDGLRLPLGRYHEDEFIAHHLIGRANRLVLTSSHLYYYWQRPESIMASRYEPRKRLDALDAYRDRAHFLREVGLHQNAIEVDRLLLKNYLKEIARALRNADEESMSVLGRGSRELALAVIQNDPSWRVRNLSRAFIFAPKLAARTYRLFLASKAPNWRRWRAHFLATSESGR